MLIRTDFIFPSYETNKIKPTNVLHLRHQLDFSPWDDKVCFFLIAYQPEEFNYLKHQPAIESEIVEIKSNFPYRPYKVEFNQQLPIDEVIPEIIYQPNWNEDNFFTRLKNSILTEGLKNPIPVCLFDEDFTWCGKEYKKNIPYMGNVGNSRYAVFKHMNKKILPVNIWYFGKTDKKLLLEIAQSI